MISKTNQIKEQITSILRAISANQSLQVEFDLNQQNNFFSWDQNLITNKKKVFLPETKSASQNFIKQSRASSDLALAYLLFHDLNIHQEKNFPFEQQKIFDEFEKIRVIAEIGNLYLGMSKNILRKIENDISDQKEQSIALVLLTELFSKEIGIKTKNRINELKKNIPFNILKAIKNLQHKVSNQSFFAQEVETIINLLSKEEESKKGNSEEKSLPSKNNKSLDQNLTSNQENIDSTNDQTSLKDEEKEENLIEKEPKISEWKEDKETTKAQIALANLNSDSKKIEFKNPYKIFSSKFDEVIFPQKLVNKAELENLRHQLDLKLAKLSSISKKMNLKLKRKLLSKKNIQSEQDNSQGILDRKKLTRLVLRPFLEDVWVSQKTNQYQDTALTILLDNSGSMRGNPIVMSALACEIIAAILEKFSIKTEIIGFTTADWKGGRARKMWELAGSSRNPGRLNELRHIIYKPFHQNFIKSKINLGLMLKEGILKENIDGEALLFARSRLMQQEEKRKIIMVISDGTPIDDSTNSTNDGDILSEHLNSVIQTIEKRSKIEIVGIGIGHTTEEFYKNSMTIKNLEELGDVMIEKICQLL